MPLLGARALGLVALALVLLACALCGHASTSAAATGLIVEFSTFLKYYDNRVGQMCYGFNKVNVSAAPFVIKKYPFHYTTSDGACSTRSLRDVTCIDDVLNVTFGETALTFAFTHTCHATCKFAYDAKKTEAWCTCGKDIVKNIHMRACRAYNTSGTGAAADVDFASRPVAAWLRDVRA
mmetsp:Transcript_22881/g.55900  ORF Transcript_22881/g.55900 Transcript_22881/m.55900 type:complete len:179 (-) Transcript_22881:147-683(-)